MVMSHICILVIIFQTVNENSLKQLSSYIETLQQNRPTRPITVTFYLRNQNVSRSANDKGSCYEDILLVSNYQYYIRHMHARAHTHMHTTFCKKYVISSCKCNKCSGITYGNSVN